MKYYAKFNEQNEFVWLFSSEGTYNWSSTAIEITKELFDMVEIWYILVNTEWVVTFVDNWWVTEYTKQTKQAEVKAFGKKDSYIVKLKQKITDLKAEKQLCNEQANKNMIQGVIDNLQTECDAEALERITLMNAAVVTHWISIADDYAEEIKKSLIWSL